MDDYTSILIGFSFTSKFCPELQTLIVPPFMEKI